MILGHNQQRLLQSHRIKETISFLKTLSKHAVIHMTPMKMEIRLHFCVFPLYHENLLILSRPWRLLQIVPLQIYTLLLWWTRMILNLLPAYMRCLEHSQRERSVSVDWTATMLMTTLGGVHNLIAIPAPMNKRIASIVSIMRILISYLVSGRNSMVSSKEKE